MTATASPRNKKPRRRLRTLGFTAAIVDGLLPVSTFANIAMNQAQRSATAPYGQRVQGFGYGYSDQPAVERTVENITSELHEALANADVPRPYVLAGHSSPATG
jgi:hypothetical protein